MARGTYSCQYFCSEYDRNMVHYHKYRWALIAENRVRYYVVSRGDQLGEPKVDQPLPPCFVSAVVWILVNDNTRS